VWVCFGCKTDSSGFVCSRPAPVVSRPKKVVKIRPKHFSIVLAGNNKNYIPNTVGMFWVQNRVIRGRLQLCSIWATLVVSKFGKVIKIQPKHFSNVLTWDDKNCTPNSVGKFRVKDRFILSCFSTLLAPGMFRWCWGPKK